jgi:hypothetical protein
MYQQCNATELDHVTMACEPSFTSPNSPPPPFLLLGSYNSRHEATVDLDKVIWREDRERQSEREREKERERMRERDKDSEKLGERHRERGRGGGRELRESAFVCMRMCMCMCVYDYKYIPGDTM